MPVHEAKGLAATRASIKIVFRLTFVETAMFQKKNNLGASVLINPKLCTLNPKKKTCTHLGSNLFKALQGFPCTYSLSLGFPPSKCTSSPAKSCNTGISAPSSRKNRPHSTWNMKKKTAGFLFANIHSKNNTCYHLPPPAPLRKCSPTVDGGNPAPLAMYKTL